MERITSVSDTPSMILIGVKWLLLYVRVSRICGMGPNVSVVYHLDGYFSSRSSTFPGHLKTSDSGVGDTGTNASLLVGCRGSMTIKWRTTIGPLGLGNVSPSTGI